jgi:Ca2+-binding EF-hand superfamily protein
MTGKIAIGIGAALLASTAAGAQPPSGHDPMRMLDSDGNGSVSLAEFRQHAAGMFRRLDPDGDGRVTVAELRAHHEAMRDRRPGQPGAGGPPPEGERGGPPPRIEQADSDGDGVVTLAEFTAMVEKHFAAADANRDGSVTPEEFQAAHRAMHGRP